MVLVDTSVWIDHLRRASAKLALLLEEGEVAIHPFVVGELACGNLKNRPEILALLSALPAIPRAENAEVLFFIDRHGLAGQGLGLIDMHLLASSQMGEFSIVPRHVLGRPGHTPPSEKLNIAGIGIGGMGAGNIHHCAEENICCHTNGYSRTLTRRAAIDLRMDMGRSDWHGT